MALKKIHSFLLQFIVAFHVSRCQKVVHGAKTCNKRITPHDSSQKWARKWFIFQRAILFDVKEDFWKMWLRIENCSKSDSCMNVVIENWLQNYLVLELCSNGDLKSYMDRRYDIFFSEIVKQLCQIGESSPQNNAMYQVRIFTFKISPLHCVMRFDCSQKISDGC